ncbi:conjugal transfer protein TraG [Lachnospiraceae bacterium]|uniref:VirD4-like conjugal transfer protein, CD1115 family n=1 Tax=Extibacter sp. GGCC_0201 TaxID=2731209 RepID=UPI001AA18F1B|nr:type IV secretory system conjugative DNA transfer family protein [Extibacter sp. GGCC_0201]MBO1722092.1 type IV secretory system conjugative DNA transfer family protein [Extibacter sp. GGCC_0201]BDF34299.1 conjugal transfer protein TraG [Lachnospiraceae bacterium]BDF38303.1 conjugal transfer protein TraG [Lachnospiraceae bacterium]
MAQNRMQERIRSSALGTAILSVVAFYLGDRIGAYIVFGLDMQLGNQVMRGLQALIAKPLYLDLNMMPLLYGFILCAIVWLVWLRYVVFVGNYRTGEESGSAQWGSEKQGLAFKDQTNSSNNLIFTKKYGLAIKRKKFDLETDRNFNVMVVGGSGSGKTRNYVKPNLMQLNANYFVTDPKGTLIGESGYLFTDNGYKVKSFNTIDFTKSQHYNPLAYVKTDADILSFVNCFIMNTTDPKKSGGDAFWENSERLLYTALIALLRDWFPKKDYSIDGLLTLLSLAEASENDEKFESPLDMLFKEIETGKAYRKNPAYYAKKRQKQQQAARNAVLQRDVIGLQNEADVDEPEYTYQSSMMKRVDGVRPSERGGLSANEDFALANYKKFKTAAGKTLKSILISCNVRLESCEISEVRELLRYDEMELDKLGDEDSKMVIFAILSDTDKTFSFLHAIMMWQAIDILCRRANIKYNGKLPRMVNFIFDEFANIGKLPDIEQTIAVTRSRNIAISIILQSMAQLDARYDKDAKTIIDCCDTTLFLGGKSNSTNKEIAEMIGDETIHQTTFGESHGQSPSGSKNMQIQGRKLIDPAEIGKMSRKDAILLIAGTNPLKDEKYPVESHQNYIYLDPGSNKKCLHDKPFDFKKYLENQKNGSSPTALRKEA